jgi:iron(II)-dependent oxidoreductase
VGGAVDQIRARLERVRERTLALIAPLDAGWLAEQVGPIMSPTIWDLAHIAAQEELWILRTVCGHESIHPDFEATFDAVEIPCAERGSIDLLDLSDCLAYPEAVRERVPRFAVSVATREGD